MHNRTQRRRAAKPQRATDTQIEEAIAECIRMGLFEEGSTLTRVLIPKHIAQAYNADVEGDAR